MVAQFQRPLVFGSVAIAIAVGSMELLDQVVGELGSYALVAGAIGAGLWWLQRPAPVSARATSPPQYVDRTVVQQTLTAAEHVLGQLQTEAAEGTPVAGMAAQVDLLRSQLGHLASDLDREALRIVVMGGKGTGKTSLIQHLQMNWQATVTTPITFLEAPSFTVGDGQPHRLEDSAAIALKQSLSADLVLFLVTGDLTASELQTVQTVAHQKRTLLVFNKQDQYLPEERQTLQGRMQEWLRESIAREDVVAIATVPRPLKVRQHQTDGNWDEWLEDQLPDLGDLTQRLTAIAQSDTPQLVLASALSHARHLRQQAASALNDLRRTRALPLVEQYQWIAAGTAFASPLPTVDLLATAAISGQMILDLGKIYQQSFSLDQAQKVVTALGSLILKLGAVELSTRAIASLLKTNALTYVAGGSIQAISAAYFTRIAGLTLIEYFHTQEPNLTLAEAKPLAIERLGQVVQQVFQQNQTPAILQALTTQVLDRLTPKAAVTATVAPSPDPVVVPAVPPLTLPLKSPEPVLAEPVLAEPVLAEPVPAPAPSTHPSLPS